MGIHFWKPSLKHGDPEGGSFLGGQLFGEGEITGGIKGKKGDGGGIIMGDVVGKTFL